MSAPDRADHSGEGADTVPDALIRAAGFMTHLSECPTARMHVGRVSCTCGMTAAKLGLMRYIRQMRADRAAPAAPAGANTLLAALTMLWERYEDGGDVFEEGFEELSPTGHAVKLSEDEENHILAVMARAAAPVAGGGAALLEAGRRLADALDDERDTAVAFSAARGAKDANDSTTLRAYVEADTAHWHAIDRVKLAREDVCRQAVRAAQAAHR